MYTSRALLSLSLRGGGVSCCCISNPVLLLQPLFSLQAMVLCAHGGHTHQCRVRLWRRDAWGGPLVWMCAAKPWYQYAAGVPNTAPQGLSMGHTQVLQLCCGCGGILAQPAHASEGAEHARVQHPVLKW